MTTSVKRFGSSWAITLPNKQNIKLAQVVDPIVQAEFFEDLSKSDKYKILSKNVPKEAFVEAGLKLYKLGVLDERDLKILYSKIQQHKNLVRKDG